MCLHLFGVTASEAICRSGNRRSSGILVALDKEFILMRRSVHATHGTAATARLSHSVRDVLVTPLPTPLDPDGNHAHSLLGHPSVEDALDLIRSHESSRFDVHSRGERHLLGKWIEALSNELAQETCACDRLQSALDKTEPYLTITDTVQVRRPWTVTNGLFAAICLAIAITMPVMTFFSQQAVLESDGRVYGVQAFAFAAFLLALPVLLEAIHEALTSDTAKRRYFIGLLVTAVAMLPVWAGTLVGGFGTGLASASVAISDVPISTETEPTGLLSTKIFLFVTIIGEACAAAAAFLAFRRTAEQHGKPTTRVPNPHCDQLKVDLDAACQPRKETRELLLATEARLSALDGMLKTQVRTAQAKYTAARAALDDLDPPCAPVASTGTKPQSPNGTAKRLRLQGGHP